MTVAPSAAASTGAWRGDTSAAVGRPSICPGAVACSSWPETSDGENHTVTENTESETRGNRPGERDHQMRMLGGYHQSQHSTPREDALPAADADEFVARALVQIPDPRRHSARYYDFYSNAARGKRRKAAAPAEPSSAGTLSDRQTGRRPGQSQDHGRRELGGANCPMAGLIESG